LTLTYFYAQKIDDNSIIDIAWGLGFIVQAGVQLLCKSMMPNNTPIGWRDILVVGLVALWGIRLTWHIGKRHEGEDWRYKEVLRKRYAHKNINIFRLKVYLFVFMLQWFIMTLCSIAP